MSLLSIYISDWSQKGKLRTDRLREEASCGHFYEARVPFWLILLYINNSLTSRLMMMLQELKSL
jgi:hypothetical protein